MPEERKPAPLPPLPWKRGPAVGDDIYIVDADGAMVAGLCGGGYDRQALCDLFCRAPALETELKQAFEDHQEVCAVVINLRALLRELAAACVERDRSEVEYQADPSQDAFLTRANARGKYADVLRRAEAEAGEEKDDLCPE